MHKRLMGDVKWFVTGDGRTPAFGRMSVYRMLDAAGPVLYAIRTRDNLIKIGYTECFANRQRQFGRVAPGYKHILAVQLHASLEDEQAIHQRLKGMAARGWEYYPWRPEVLAVVNEMRGSLGLEPLDEADQYAPSRNRLRRGLARRRTVAMRQPEQGDHTRETKERVSRNENILA